MSTYVIVYVHEIIFKKQLQTNFYDLNGTIFVNYEPYKVSAHFSHYSIIFTYINC